MNDFVMFFFEAEYGNKHDPIYFIFLDDSHGFWNKLRRISSVLMMKNIHKFLNPMFRPLMGVWCFLCHQVPTILRTQCNYILNEIMYNAQMLVVSKVFAFNGEF